MISRINTAVCVGMNGETVVVETDITNGLPQINIVGLASTMVMESRERIKSAILNSGFEYPRRRLTINLIPAGLRKTGTHLDLPMAMGILTSMRYIDPNRLEQYGIIGELSLEGRVLPVEGVLPMIFGMQRTGIRKFILPAKNLLEASLAEDAVVIGVESLQECVDVLRTDDPSEYMRIPEPVREAEPCGALISEVLDFADIRGQESAKRAVVIAVAGKHGMLMMGNPGCGKTMTARRIPTILPQMTQREVVEDTIIYSVSGKIDPAEGAVRWHPFRMPHHSIGKAGLLGGGTYPMPGEITLAHNGVLFLDELSEFDRGVIESLRVPLDRKEITHFRNGKAYRFPCDFLLVMASNPCPCGYFGDPEHPCKCSQAQLEHYRRKLSGALIERIDILVRMEKVKYDSLTGRDKDPISSADMRAQIAAAKEYASRAGRRKSNADLDDAEVQELLVSDPARQFLEAAYSALHLSPRTYIKALKVARTIADLDQSEGIELQHISEALSYRTAMDDIYAEME